MMSMSQEDRERRMKAILEKTKKLFLQDAYQRAAELKENIALWEQNDSHRESEANGKLGESMYRYAHTLKGVALTVGCEGIHQLSEAADSYSIQHLDAWTEETLRTMIQFLEQLFKELYREMDKEN
ncbi:Hpt domain-containing protein [Paenibacillus radicis (ex Xue et al. 2023)]|uniref:Hpt domain-containing protein n=1 Tax=Paenibacillus radicis (ex Xue et al. 2023) TaxID=2972489 RepID=A0ABT1YV73_9BACL|nr:Hpt domain-containing protein [Paenibacillus radicis (ex Xue et al. 2023)]MCR8636852.1 Hpt domain-containing protein [Paenibacillus radicis (ex Xue et al. 2023)]